MLNLGYISSVRSTNVYEERSLGVFEEEEEEKEPSGDGSRVAVWGKYLSWHARKQLAFGLWPSYFHHLHILLTNTIDMWWIGLALFLVCIIEVCSCSDADIMVTHPSRRGANWKTRITSAGLLYLLSVCTQPLHVIYLVN